MTTTPRRARRGHAFARRPRRPCAAVLFGLLVAMPSCTNAPPVLRSEAQLLAHVGEIVTIRGELHTMPGLSTILGVSLARVSRELGGATASATGRLLLRDLPPPPDVLAAPQMRLGEHFELMDPADPRRLATPVVEPHPSAR